MTLWVATKKGTNMAMRCSSLYGLFDEIKTMCLYSRSCISDFTFRTERLNEANCSFRGNDGIDGVCGRCHSHEFFVPDHEVNAMMDTGLSSLRANANEQAEGLQEVSKPVVRFLHDYCSTDSMVIITQHSIKLMSADCTLRALT